MRAPQAGPTHNPGVVVPTSDSPLTSATPSRTLQLGIFAREPIEHEGLLYRALAETPGIGLTVYFARRMAVQDEGTVMWDDREVVGYRAVWLHNAADAKRPIAGAPARRRFRDYDTPDIADILDSDQCDALLLSGWDVRAEWQAIRAARALGMPLLVRSHRQVRDDGPVARAIKLLINRAVLRLFAVCLSTGVRSEEYFRHYGARRIVSAPAFVDNRYFADRAATLQPLRARRRSRWGVAGDALVVLSVGRLVARRRPLDLIRALRGVRGVHAVVAGDGPLRVACSALARRLGVPITLTGNLNRGARADAYAAADVVVEAASAAPWSHAVNEAMASGRPAIVADAVVFAPDLVREGVTGYTYPVGDDRALRDLLDEFLIDPSSSKRMGAAAAEHIVGFSATAAAAGIVTAARVADESR
jgi:glycosyltransferase involved in cell wall biosynthesis